jgi:hypothetical protein
VSYPNCAGFGTAVTNYDSGIASNSTQKVVQAFAAFNQSAVVNGSSRIANGPQPRGFEAISA